MEMRLETESGVECRSPPPHMSALSLRKSDELIRQVLKVSKAKGLGTLKQLHEWLPRNLVGHKSTSFFPPHVSLFPCWAIRFCVFLDLKPQIILWAGT